MKYFYIEPEVAGGLGENTVMDCSVHPPVVSKLHYHLDGWLGDVLLESFPSFIATKEAGQQLQAIGVTGLRLDDVEVTISDQFRQLYPNPRLPGFVWFRAEGQPGRDDFGTAPDGRLVASERALAMLTTLGIAHALVTPFQP
jgi:hypothetical protein